jgi:N-acetylglutamate synthase-like GNAT family acetyltransferase
MNIDSDTELEKLAEWSVADNEMLPLSTESIARHQMSTAAYVFGELAGYGAISVIYSRDVIEFGGLVVNPDLRRYKIGTGIVRHVVTRALEELNPELILAFGNEKSSRLFQKLGGAQVQDVSVLPAEVWKLCHICPRLNQARSEAKSCCERVYDITSIGKEG